MSDDKPEKPVRLPWEPSPWQDYEANTSRAIAAATSAVVDTNSAAVQSYAEKALHEEVETLRNTPKGQRNGQLFKSGANLYELVFAGALKELEVDAALHDSCIANHYIQDKGERQFAKSLNSAKRRGRDNPRDLSNVGTKSATGNWSYDTSDDNRKVLVLTDFQRLERGFWTERDSLQIVYLAALSRMCSPWAVLAHCIARALAMVRPHITLPALIGGPGSLNWFAAVTAISGGGKGSAAAVAKELVPNDIRARNLGSGEGVIDAYAKPADKESGAPAGTYESIAFEASEIDGLTALGQRSGSLLMPTLRSGFSAEQLGSSNRTASSLHLPAHSYRMTLIIQGQPERCGALLGDANGGTPQRFQWFPGTDDRITAEPPAWPGQLVLPRLSVWQYPTELKVPYETIELIRDERARAMRGEQDALDGHALFVREKFAYGLAVLDGRHEMSLDDWRLAGTAMRVSDHVRAYVAQAVDSAQVDQATREGKSLGVKRFAADQAQAQHVSAQRSRVARWCVDKLTAAGDEGLTVNALKRASTGADRGWVEQALDWLARHGSAAKIERQPKDRTDRWSAL